MTTEAGKRLLVELEDMVEEAVADQEHFANWWVNECRIAVEEDLPDIEAEARAAVLRELREEVAGMEKFTDSGRCGAPHCFGRPEDNERHHGKGRWRHAYLPSYRWVTGSETIDATLAAIDRRLGDGSL